MTFNIPIFVEERSNGANRPPTFIVRPLFAVEPTQRAEKLSRALARLSNDLQNHLHQLGQEPRHEELATWSFQPPFEETTLELRLELDSGSQKCRFFFVGYAALGRKLWFTPTLPNLRFELLPGQDLTERATEVLTRQFRQLERTEFLDITEHVLVGKGRLTVLPLAIQPAVLARKAAKPTHALLFGDEEKIDGERELRRVGRSLQALYPDDLQRAVGLGRELDELAHLLAASDRRPVVLVGPRMVGKTTLLHELTWQTVARKKERYAGGRELWLVSPMRLISGMSQLGEWESRVTAILDHASRKDRVLYFDDLLGLFSAGQSNASDLSVAQVLKPALARRSVRVIAETTPEAWRVLRERDRGFADLFHVIPLAEPAEADTLRVLIDVVRRLEAEHRCRFDLEVVPTVYELHRRHAGDSAFPGKAAGFLSRLALRHTGTRVSREIVLEEFQRISGLKTALIDDRLPLDRASLVGQLRTQVLGQEPVLDAFADVLVALKARLNDPRRPLGTLLLLGPTGVGKTESAKALARLLFGTDERLLRLDMNEFVDGASAARLTGTPQDPEGVLTSAIRRQPFSVVLLDEFEKAAPEVSDLLLAVLDEGRLTDSLGRVADFTQSVILLTSNLGAREARSHLGFRAGAHAIDEDAAYLRAAEQFFRPEFFNRLDRVIPFRSLDRTQLEGIARRLIGQVLSREGLLRRRCLLHTSAAAFDRLVSLGHHPQLGARALKRVVERELTQPLAARLANAIDSVPMVALLDATGSGFELRTRTVDLMTREVEWPALIAGLTTGSVGCAPQLIDAIHEAVDRIESHLESEAPTGPMELGAIPRTHARYFLCRERIARIRQRLDAIEEEPERRRLRPTIHRRPTAKSSKVIPHSTGSSRSILARQRAAASLEADLADLVDREPLTEDRTASPLLDVTRELAILEAMAAGRPDEQVALACWRSIDGTDTPYAGSLASLLCGRLASIAGITVEQLPPSPNGHGHGRWQLIQGFHLLHLLPSGPHLAMLERADASISFIHFDIVFVESAAEGRRLALKLQQQRHGLDLNSLGPVMFRGIEGLEDGVESIAALTDLRSAATLRTWPASPEGPASLFLSGLRLPRNVEIALTSLKPSGAGTREST
jgi:ATP-dependent Clp protease ATP-binding subunit ClpA